MRFSEDGDVQYCLVLMTEKIKKIRDEKGVCSN